MRISQQLPKFTEKTMFIVTGKQDARFYIAHGDVIERVASFRIRQPNYSDREGFRQFTPAGIRGMISGSVLNPVDRAIRLEFRHTIAATAAALFRLNQIKRVILFAPRQFISDTKLSLPKNVQAIITHIIAANLYESHPFELIKRYQLTRIKHL